MSATIAKLDEQGFIRKKPMNDTRYKKVSLSEKGKKAAKIIEHTMDVHCAKTFKNLSPDEVETLGELSSKVYFDYNKEISDLKSI